MTAVERGRRIKEARIAKKMTQSEVVGSFITRNMLSQIESGSAVPSLKTLEYLAEVLDIPITSLMPQGDNDERSAHGPEADSLARSKELYRSGLYSEALSIAENEDRGTFSDEFAAIKARCCLRLAEQFSESDFQKASEYAKEAAALAKVGFYASGDIKTAAAKLLNELAEKLKKYYEEIISGL